MESDSDINRFGEIVEEVINSKAVDIGVKAAIAANPGSAAAISGIKAVTDLVAKLLRNNDDDELFRVNGTFLRDRQDPYHIGQRFTRMENDFIDLSMEILPLVQQTSVRASA